MRRIATLLAVTIVVLAASLGTGASHHGSAAGLSARQADLQGTLTVFDYTTFENGPTGKTLLAEYHRLHPHVTVKIIGMPAGDPTAWEQNVLAAGTAPDIVMPSYSQQAFSSIAQNYWLDLTAYLRQPNPYVRGNKRWIDVFDPLMNAQNSFAGRYFIVSYGGQDCAVFYNKDIFKKAGITSVPTTWAELLADSARIKKAGYIPTVFPLGDTYPIDVNGSIASLLENQVMSRTFHALDTNHDGVVDIKELIVGYKRGLYSPMNKDYQEAWRLLKEWSQSWQPNPIGTRQPVQGLPAPLRLFTIGQAAMEYGAQFMIPNIVSAKVKFNWGAFKMPPITRASSPFASSSGESVGIWGAWNALQWGVPASTKAHGHLALALDFLQFITRPDLGTAVALDNSTVPIFQGYHPKPGYDTLFYDLVKHPSMQFAAEASLGIEWLKERIATQQNYLTGQETLDEAMADMKRSTDAAVARLTQAGYGLNL